MVAPELVGEPARALPQIPRQSPWLLQLRPPARTVVEPGVLSVPSVTARKSTSDHALEQSGDVSEHHQALTGTPVSGVETCTRSDRGAPEDESGERCTVIPTVAHLQCGRSPHTPDIGAAREQAAPTPVCVVTATLAHHGQWCTLPPSLQMQRPLRRARSTDCSRPGHAGVVCRSCHQSTRGRRCTPRRSWASTSTTSSWSQRRWR